MQKSNFKWRKFISFSLFLAFFWMGVSGLVLYIAPPGRVFRWTSWHFLWLDLDQWQILHTIFSYFFIGFVVVHLFSMNWKVFLSYLKTKIKSGKHSKRELSAALLLAIVVTIGSLFKMKPFNWVMDLGELASEYWGNKLDYPPVAHAEEMTLDEMARKLLGISGEEFMDRIRKAGFKVENQSQTFAEVANLNEVAPYQLFKKITVGLDVLVIPSVK